MKATTRKVTVGGALLATLAASYFAPPANVVVVRTDRQSTSSEGLVSAHPARTGRTAVHHELAVLVIQPRDADGSEAPAGLFAASASAPASSLSIQLPLVREAAALAEPPPVPPVPFRFLGSFAEDGRVGIFVEFGEQSMIAKVGDTLAGAYRIEALGEQTLTVTYLPMDRQQTIDIGAPVSR